MSDYAFGIYVLTTWATATGADAVKVRTNFLKAYSYSTVEGIGRAARQLNFGELATEFRDIYQRGANKENPTIADINSGIIKVGGKGASYIDAISGAISDTGEGIKNVAESAFSFSKILLVAVIVGGVVYIGWTTGILRGRK